MKRLYDPPSSRAAMEILREDGSVSKDIKEILEKCHQDISKLFLGLRDNPEIAFNEDFYYEIKTKKEEFDNISSTQQQNQGRTSSKTLNSDFLYVEVSKCIDSTKLKKAYLELPNEVTKNNNAKTLLHNFFNLETP